MFPEIPAEEKAAKWLSLFHISGLLKADVHAVNMVNIDDDDMIYDWDFVWFLRE